MAKRKNKYNTHVQPRMIEIKGWIKNGMIDKDVAGKLKIAYSTFREYVEKYPELAEAVYTSKQVADLNVFNSLYEKAINRYVPIEEVYKIKESHYDDKGKKVETEKLEMVTVQKYIAAEFPAQAFWLKNRLPDTWRDRIDASISGNLGIIPVDEETIAKMMMVIENETT